MSVPPGIALPPLSRLSPRVIRILGLNPGPFTLGGTNTYLLGVGRNRLLIDTGEGHPGHLENLRLALAGVTHVPSDAHAPEEKPRVPTTPEGAEIEMVLLTHHHPDHIGGVPLIASHFPNARFFKAPSATSDVEVFETLRSAGFTKEIEPIAPMQQFRVDGATVTAIPAPGHTDDHVVLLLEEEGSLFTGDVILGVGSSVFAKYGDYMATLQRLRALAPKGRIYPGHAELCENSIAKIDEYIEHRHAREQQLIEALAQEQRRSHTKRGMTLRAIVKVVYADTPEHLHAAAAGNMLQYLRKLLVEGRVFLDLPMPGATAGADVGDEARRVERLVAFLNEDEYVTSGEGKRVGTEQLALALESRWLLVSDDSSAKL